MFSNVNAKQADMCRFCWMCRHICPVAGATGSEGWGPRARGLMVSLIERGTEYDAEIADAMYHCTMCDACANDCVTGWKPTDFTREARMLAVVNDIAPKAIMTEIENIIEKGNIYGAAVDGALAARLEKLPGKAEVLVYLGQTGRTCSAETAMALLDLLDKAGVKYTALPEEKPTGAFLGDLMGFTGDVQSIAGKAAADIQAAGAKQVVALSPYDAVMLRDKFAEWGLLPGVEILSAPKFIAGLIADGALKPEKTGLRASVQEPVKLTRGLEEEQPVLDIIAALGIDLISLFLHGKMSRCVGTPLMECYDADVARHMVEVRMDDARRIGSDVILACSADDMYLMSKYAEADIQVVDLFVLLNKNC